MKGKFVVTLLSGLSYLGGYADANVKIEGSSLKVIEISPEASTGLNNLFVVYNTEGCRFTFNSSKSSELKAFKFSNLGGAYSQEVSNAELTTSSISFPLTKEDLGYIIEESDRRYYYWVVNYNNHPMFLDGIRPSDEPECNYSVLNIDKSAPAIQYYTITGQQKILSREIFIDYTTQIFNGDLPGYEIAEERKVYESLSSRLSIAPPAYCSTYFTISGDRFLREWGRVLSAETGMVYPVAVECVTDAEQLYESGDEGSNIMKGDDSGLGGSAPANITFLAYTTEGVVHHEWQLSRSQEFENPEYRFYEQNLDYTFTETGTWYLRYIGSNADGTCETFGDVYTVSIGASALECPNAFSPNGDGVNDIWKVSYRSLIDFHCEIFNRNGQLVYSFDDPSGGWDGTWHGKTVKPGVYYYVIMATGSDGQNYKKSGDINIINARSMSPGYQEPSIPDF